jgi:putative DNA primase/helicase
MNEPKTRLHPDCVFELGEEIFPPPEPETFHATDAGNARRFASNHAETIRYCPDLKRWYAWDGTRWAADNGTEVMRRAKATALAVYGEAAACPDSGNRMQLARLAAQMESAARLEAMIKLAQSERDLTVSPSEFDKSPMLLNVKNGVVDLRTGALLPHDPSLMLTKLAPVNYEPTARCPLWLSFLDRTFGSNAELVQFIQRALGYSLTGHTDEQVMFVAYGTGANGKSTMIETVRSIMGDYAMQTPAELLLSKSNVSGGGPSPELVRLRGERFVTAAEADAGRKLAEAAVKQFTGGDTLAGRDLHSSFVEFRPEFKLWLATNHKPDVRGRDEGIWRRIKLIPFTVTIPEPERDRQLADKLRGEMPGILTWLVRGAMEWKRQGLAVPKEVSSATSAYREDTDTLAEFVDECLVPDAGAFISSADLNQVYQEWADRSNADKLTKTKLGSLIGERPGFQPGRQTGKRGFVGHRLKQP